MVPARYAKYGARYQYGIHTALQGLARVSALRAISSQAPCSQAEMQWAYSVYSDYDQVYQWEMSSSDDSAYFVQILHATTTGLPLWWAVGGGW